MTDHNKLRERVCWDFETRVHEDDGGRHGGGWIVRGGRSSWGKPAGPADRQPDVSAPAEILKGNFAGVLKELKQIGVDQIELCGPIGTGYPEFAPLKDAAGSEQDDSGRGLRP